LTGQYACSMTWKAKRSEESHESWALLAWGFVLGLISIGLKQDKKQHDAH